MKNLQNAISIVALLIFSCNVAAQQRGSATVTVLDQSGNLVSNARVMMEPIHNKPVFKSITTGCDTDQTGICTNGSMRFGEYEVSASKVSERYPEMYLSVYRTGKKFPHIILTEDAPTATVTVVLGPKAASLKINVIDDQTGKPIKNPTVAVESPSDKSHWISTGLEPDGTILIPQDEDIVIEVAAEGYQPWKQIEDFRPVGQNVLHMQSDEHREITVRLKAKTKDAPPALPEKQ